MKRAENFCRTHGITFGPQLGAGAQGVVFSTDRESAIKVHGAQAAYVRERDAYLRLAEFAVDQIHGLIVPRMRQSDDRLLILEMTRVHRNPTRQPGNRTGLRSSLALRATVSAATRPNDSHRNIRMLA